MLNMKPYGATGRLAASITPGSTEITLEDAFPFHVPAGDYFYLTLRDGTSREVVRVTRNRGNTLIVDRGVDSTVARDWGAGACAQVEWNPAQLKEFMALGGVTGGVMTPGVYCLGCASCITVDSSGRITAINGQEGC